MTGTQGNRSRAYMAVLIVITAVLLARGLTDAGFVYSDDARHAMDGVFFMDFFKDLPLFHLYDYVTQYYTKYPALGVGYYPPFFAIVEAPFFWIFGISITSARLCVAFFTFIAVIFWFRLVRQIYDEQTAFYSSLLFVTTPFVITWARGVMLEMPSLALIIVAVYGFYNFIAHDSRRHGLLMVLATVAAGYTKQTTVFIIPMEGPGGLLHGTRSSSPS
jgi:4-amino-4-deoxy-L-arabinose transferase-like glycosyltransferase